MATAHNGQIVKLTPLEVEKSNNAKGISAGQAALAARSFSQTANVDDGKKPLFDIEIFDNLESAMAYASEINAAEGGPLEATPISSQEDKPTGWHSTIKNVKHSELYLFTKQWRAWVQEAQDLDDDDEDPEIPVNHHFKSFKTMIVMTDGAQKLYATVDGSITEYRREEAFDGGKKVILGGSYKGKEYTAVISDTELIECIKNGTIVLTESDVVEDDDSMGFAFDDDIPNFVVAVFRGMPKSSKQSEGNADLGELYILCRFFEGCQDKRLAELDFDAASRKQLRDVSATVKRIVLALTIDQSKTTATMWSTEPSHLGKQILMFSRVIAKDKASDLETAQFPFVQKLKAKCRDEEEWNLFLRQAIEFYVPEKHVKFCEEKASSYILHGKLNSFLKGCLNVVESIGELIGHSSGETLILFITELAEKKDESLRDEARQLTHGREAGGSSAVTLSDPTSISFVGNHVQLVSTATDAPSETQQREMTQLKQDAGAIAGDKDAIATLGALKAIKDTGTTAMLKQSMDQCTNPRVLRLINYEGNLEKVLQGAYANMATICVSIRNGLEKQLADCMKGAQRAPLISDKLNKAYRKVRLGKLSIVKIFDLLDLPDNGTAENPLKYLQGKPSLECKHLVNKAMQELQQCLTYSFPAQTVEINMFFGPFREKLEKAIEDGVQITEIGKYYAGTIRKVCETTSKFSSGEASHLKLLFDTEWLGISNDHCDEFRQATLRALASQFGGGGGKGIEKKNIKKRELESKGDKPEKKADKKDVKPDRNVAGAEERLLKNSDGLYEKRVPKGHKLLIKWNKDNPKIDGKFKCWNESNYKEGCKNPHCWCYHESDE